MSTPLWLILFVLVVCDRVLVLWQHALAIRQSYEARRDTATSAPAASAPSQPRSTGGLGRPQEHEGEAVLNVTHPQHGVSHAAPNPPSQITR